MRQAHLHHDILSCALLIRSDGALIRFEVAVVVVFRGHCEPVSVIVRLGGSDSFETPLNFHNSHVSIYVASKDLSSTKMGCMPIENDRSGQ